MATTTKSVVEPVIGEGVMEVLQEHGAVEEFWDRLKIARDYVPEMIALSVDLLHDPDEDGRVWVDMTATVPSSISWEQGRFRSHRYIEECVRHGFPGRLLLSFILHVFPAAEGA